MSIIKLVTMVSMAVALITMVTSNQLSIYASSTTKMMGGERLLRKSIRTRVADIEDEEIMEKRVEDVSLPPRMNPSNRAAKIRSHVNETSSFLYFVV